MSINFTLYVCGIEKIRPEHFHKAVTSVKRRYKFLSFKAIFQLCERSRTHSFFELHIPLPTSRIVHISITQTYQINSHLQEPTSYI
jgi:hypothetical protein